MKPRGWGFLAFILSVEFLLFSLGTWQIFRWCEKKEISQITALKFRSPPIELSRLRDDASLDFHPILVKGTFLHTHEKRLQPRTFEGKSGVHVVTPFQLEDGRTILVDRGWSSVPALPIMKRSHGPILLQGTLQAVKPPRFFTPRNDPEKDLWYVLDPLCIFSPISFKKIYVASLKEGGWDANSRAPLPALRNFHLEYALTWYTLMGCVFIAYQVLRRQEKRGL